MVLAVYQIHKVGIIHRDIKLENYLIKKDTITDELNIQLNDFGRACMYYPNEPPSKKIGTLSRMAPEVFLYTHYDAKIDCWTPIAQNFDSNNANVRFFGVSEPVSM